MNGLKPRSLKNISKMDKPLARLNKSSLMAECVKNLSVMQETQELQFQSLGWEDSLEEEMATHYSIPV